jgi:signal transduction histidine kinase
VSYRDLALPEWLRLQEELVHLVAHDMRNPLQAIMANASFLDDATGATEQEAHETTSDIRSSADVLLRLIENSVTIARLESPSAEALPRVPVSLLAAVEAAMERCAGIAASSAISLSLEASLGARVMADPQLLDQMIQNLITNGIQHSRRRSSVSLRVERQGERTAVVLLDQGAPFGPVERHFTREAQATIKFQPDGRYSRGLGLYVVGLVSRAFGGTIEPSREGARSALRVWFPVASSVPPKEIGPR